MLRIYIGRSSAEAQIKYYVYALKEPTYVMKIIATHGTTDQPADAHAQRTVEVDGERHTINFNYPDFFHFHHHCEGRHSVDDHNNQRVNTISLEETYGTKWWMVTQPPLSLPLVCIGGECLPVC